MLIPREARFIIFLRAQRVDVSGLQTWIPNSFVRSKNAKKVS